MRASASFLAAPPILHWRTYACRATIRRSTMRSRTILPIVAVCRCRARRRSPFASAITGDHVAMTNHPWSFSIAALKAQFGFDRLEVINDFTALALALPDLGPDDRMSVGGGTAAPGTPLAVLGPGSGLGVSGLVAGGSGWMALAGEGGHATMAPATDREERGARPYAPAFRPRLGRAAAVGPGSDQPLQYAWRSSTASCRAATPRRRLPISELRGEDPLCAEATTMFCAMLGTMAGNLALTLGARGGVFIAGGIVPRLGQFFVDSPFRERFRGQGPVRTLSRGDPDLCRDPSIAGVSRLRRAAGRLKWDRLLPRNRSTQG